jgi:hypothetical protein
MVRKIAFVVVASFLFNGGGSGPRSAQADEDRHGAKCEQWLAVP